MLGTLLADALGDVADYRITKSARGFTVWLFTPWCARSSGWRVVSRHSSQEDAEEAILGAGLARIEAEAHRDAGLRVTQLYPRQRRLLGLGVAPR